MTDIEKKIEEILDVQGQWCEECEHPGCISAKKARVEAILKLIESERDKTLGKIEEALGSSQQILLQVDDTEYLNGGYVSVAEVRAKLKDNLEKG